MEKIIGIRDLQNSGLLDVEYTESDLCDAFLMYWISNNKLNNGHIVLRNGDFTLDIRSYFAACNWMV
ncbi:conserved hypothetical protein [Candidatus Brocadia pituitae]|nr:conserved hypothetical protein [Candidatus Brocadia pituitae]